MSAELPDHLLSKEGICGILVVVVLLIFIAIQANKPILVDPADTPWPRSSQSE
jgi:hypothetical protein